MGGRVTPAAIFHAAACSVLESGGITPTKIMIARIVGERQRPEASAGRGG